MEGNQYIVLHGEAESKEEAIQLCGKALYEAGVASKEFASLCIEREKEYPTGLPTVIPTAIPHAKDEQIKENYICFLKLDEPVAFQRMDDDSETIYTKYIFNLAIHNSMNHIKVLQNMMEFLNDEEALSEIEKMNDDEIVSYLKRKIG